MQYTVKRTCGHETSENLFGKGSERERRLSWLREQPCLPCKRSAEQQHAEAATVTLPALVGTDKQVAWATRIRAEKLAAIATLVAEYEAKTGESCPSDIASAATRLQHETNAAGWIDRRECGPRELLRQAVA